MQDTENMVPAELAPEMPPLSLRELSSRELFRSGNTVRIKHAGQTYWLRLTRGNKLILTK